LLTSLWITLAETCPLGGILVVVLGLSVAAGQEGQDRPATPSEQYEAPGVDVLSSHG
jgi:hypothetical protein